MRWPLRIALAALMALVVVATLIVSTWYAARREMAALEPPIPGPEAMWQAVDGASDRPLRLAWITTARQRMPRAAVIEPSVDPTPDREYVMGHPSFVLEWPDGRLLLVDVGMSAEGARAFGGPLEWAAGVEPIEPQGSVAARLGNDVERVAGIVFTHLHIDHVEGLGELCAARSEPLPIYQTSLQNERSNYTTLPAREQLAASSCARPMVLAGAAPLAVAAFPGVAVIPVAGHTPGSQLVVVRLATGDRRFVLAGDIANHEEALLENWPKPHLYSLLVVPENTERLARLRQHLAEVAARGDAQVLVSHDLLALEASGLEPWRASDR